MMRWRGCRTASRLDQAPRSGAEITSSATWAVLVTYALGMFGSPVSLTLATASRPGRAHAARAVKRAPFGLMIFNL